MKNLVLAAAVLLTAGASAYARGEGGCIKKPGRPRVSVGEAPSLTPLVPVCTNPKGCKP